MARRNVLCLRVCPRGVNNNLGALGGVAMTMTMDGLRGTRQMNAYLDLENVVLVGVSGSHNDERLSSDV